MNQHEPPLDSPKHPSRRFILLLGTLLLLFLVAPLLDVLGEEGSHTAGQVLSFIFMVMLFFAVFATSPTKGRLFIAIGLMAPAMASRMAAEFAFRTDEAAQVIRHAFTLIFFSYVVVVSLQEVFRSRQVTVDAIAASLCIYLFLGLIWADAYAILHILVEDSLSISLEDGMFDDNTYYYFSFVTMTTLGYGDIVPTVPLSRAVATLQAVIGQMYLTVLVARLVGLHIAHANRPRQA